MYISLAAERPIPRVRPLSLSRSIAHYIYLYISVSCALSLSFFISLSPSLSLSLSRSLYMSLSLSLSRSLSPYRSKPLARCVSLLHMHALARSLERPTDRSRVCARGLSVGLADCAVYCSGIVANHLISDTNRKPTPSWWPMSVSYWPV